ncbi:uncharacterized protein PADG_00455 [Paracoccidioides brasiliensis Pb18]|uniref:Protein arginine methyltransferase NDUFAF7 n=1 Tax=Paracoccidioides brasiliensis (strain Pb18) TaxID=502780 RepID=C1G0R5_PARBD|nr:uncharacterized protein PADG_00455 [Paracoccidioides brasiliensis Pb18]EEH44166.1 hypothetical protein PADG_00455 [Paracoccidioides brasiliensis Pb18]ODH50601.1 hypothetical protein GX48_03283 [Paracoccidioides brasiliensis]
MSNGSICFLLSRLARAGRYPRLGGVNAKIHLVRWSSTSAPDSAPRQWSTPLAKTIAEAISVTGPISIAAYMRQCLTSPDGGYYTSRGQEAEGTEVFGAKGDFVTSPEISQIFGELLGIWTVAEWMGQGRRKGGVQIIELGPGKGTLMADMLRSIRNFKTFASAIEAVYLVEASTVLREVQHKLLCGDAPTEEIEVGYKSTSVHLGVPVIWTEHIKLLPDEPDKTPFIFAHEFFDALPIHAFQSIETPPRSQTINTPTGPATLHNPPATSSSPATQWRELVVSPNPEIPELKSGNEPEFHLSLAKSPTPSSLVLPEMSPRYKAMKSTPGSTIEISPEGQTCAQDIARRIGGSFSSSSSEQSNKKRVPSGAALILDYGTTSTIPINSLRGIRKHQLVSPFAVPGQVDISANVDFTALAEAAIDASPGVEVYGPVEQCQFLEALGISKRASQLLTKVEGEGGEEKRKRIESGWKRLVERGGGGMGKLYKALAIVPESGGRRRPVGFGVSVLG